MKTSVVTIISSFTAFFAVVIAPLISIYVIKTQVKMTVLSANRQVWITELRKDISEFISLLTSISIYEFRKSSDKTSKTLDAIEKASFLKCKISLMLNPLEEDHKRIIKLVEEAYDTILDDTNLDAWHHIMENLIKASQVVLKGEWKRVTSLS